MSKEERQKLDMDAVRAKLANKQGPEFWQSLDDLADTPEFREFVKDEFPQAARTWSFDMDRRSFIKFLGGTLALGGLTGCRVMTRDKIVPYVRQPEDLTPGKPLFFATAALHRGYGTGVLATSHEGRPTKLEGNPDHPACLGGCDSFTQASIYNLYDPDRSKSVMKMGAVATWDSFAEDTAAQLANLKPAQGEGLNLLCDPITSPTIHAQLQRLRTMYPKVKLCFWDPVTRENSRIAAKSVFGEALDPVYHFDQADVVVSLDSDFLLSVPGSARYAREFAAKRRMRSGTRNMSRLYVTESSVSVTGACADHRMPIRPTDVPLVARLIAAGLGLCSPPDRMPAGLSQSWLDAVVADLKEHAGNCLVVAGEQQSQDTLRIAWAINDALGNFGKTVTFVDPPDSVLPEAQIALRELTADMEAGRVRALLILNSNPIFTAPADLRFFERLKKVPFRVHVGSHFDETGSLCDWHLPLSHELESWGDARAYDGTVSIIQPLIEPLFETRSITEALEAIMGEPKASYEIVSGYWKSQQPTNFDKAWASWLNKGVVAGSAPAPKTPTMNKAFLQGLMPVPEMKSVDCVFQPDPNVWDGRYADNGWLQEQPRPITLLTWDNAFLISHNTAKKWGVEGGDVVELSLAGETAKGPVWVVPGHPDGTVTIQFGNGRKKAGAVGTGAGFNAYPLRRMAGMFVSTGIKAARTKDKVFLVSTQDQHSMRGSYSEHGRNLVRVGTLEDFLKRPESFAKTEADEEPLTSMWDAPDSFAKYEGYQWAMSIDTNTCIGCNACMTACQAENNIPVVGKDQTGMGRQMTWIRVDRYYRGETLDNPETYFQPVTCMHCEKAPCEPVCPVGATVHSHEGLNQMVYNRCIGTRYCSNNCPYKVRRFNFYKYVAGQPDRVPANNDQPTLRLLANPDVTVRGRGVMEKCTYCVQRINAARITAKNEGREVKDGEIVTACQQACPTEAIVFGNIADKESRVAKLKAEPHDYTMLRELNARPRTTYLAKIRNPHGGAQSG